MDAPSRAGQSQFVNVIGQSPPVSDITLVYQVQRGVKPTLPAKTWLLRVRRERHKENFQTRCRKMGSRRNVCAPHDIDIMSNPGALIGPTPAPRQGRISGTSTQCLRPKLASASLLARTSRLCIGRNHTCLWKPRPNPARHGRQGKKRASHLDLPYAPTHRRDHAPSV